MKIICSYAFSLFLLISNAFATGTGLPNGNNLFGKGINTTIISGIDSAMSLNLKHILILLYKIGCAISVCVLIWIGIQFILASPQKKAEVKSSMLPYLVGILLVVAGVPIAIKVIDIFITIF